MASIDDGEILLEIDGASREELERGLRAARRVFTAREVTPAEAEAAAFTVLNVDASFGPEERERAAVFAEALNAAERAACGEWENEPEWIDLTVVDPANPPRALDEPHYKLGDFEPPPELPLGLPLDAVVAPVP